MNEESFRDKLTLDKELFTIPEVLFNPSDIGESRIEDNIAYINECM